MPGVSGTEEWGNTNEGLQTLSPSLHLQFSLDTLQLFILLSFKIYSIYCLVMDLFVKSGFDYIEHFFSSSRSMLPVFPHVCMHTFYISKTSLMLLFTCCFVHSLWEVCPGGVIAGVSSSPLHQQKCLCTCHQGRATSCVVELPYYLVDLFVGCGGEAEWFALISPHVWCLPPGWWFGNLGGSMHWVVEGPLQPLAWAGLAAISCRHLLTRQRISLVPPVSPHHSVPCPAGPARGRWGSACRPGCLHRAGIPRDRSRPARLRKRGVCFSLSTAMGVRWACLIWGSLALEGYWEDWGEMEPTAESLHKI